MREYAASEGVTVYGSSVAFKDESLVPSVTTAEISDISYLTAMGGGTIVSPGSSDILSVGICWSTEANRTTENDNTHGYPSESVFATPLDEPRSGSTDSFGLFAA